MPGIRSRAYLYSESRVFTGLREYRVWLNDTAMLCVIFGIFCAQAQDRANLCVLRGAKLVLSSASPRNVQHRF
ncbi:hypothetical protein L596_003706 [Steinernema carpocapsae]|uniref:Uncharacterized protein n=1 Tax=Steinernema carpocapsae TaxID=34508 RepID=A0A4V6YSW6_STECR|nr:hypothetical protein L596_003706 [Steinernema carpocapsae]